MPHIGEMPHGKLHRHLASNTYSVTSKAIREGYMASFASEAIIRTFACRLQSKCHKFVP